MTGSAKGESVFIPRIPMIPSDYPFQFKRIQFSVKGLLDSMLVQLVEIWLDFFLSFFLFSMEFREKYPMPVS
ncbi:hypothetical protein QTP88_027625 [Uroleucon formosanum]